MLENWYNVIRIDVDFLVFFLLVGYVDCGFSFCDIEVDKFSYVFLKKKGEKSL